MNGNENRQLAFLKLLQYFSVVDNMLLEINENILNHPFCNY